MASFMDLREEVPREFSDDERWYRFFTRKSIVVLLVMGVISLLLVKFLGFIGLRTAGVYIALILSGAVMLAVMLPIPEGDVLHGSGCTCDVILFRMLVRKRTGRVYRKICQTEREEKRHELYS